MGLNVSRILIAAVFTLMQGCELFGERCEEFRFDDVETFDEEAKISVYAGFTKANDFVGRERFKITSDGECIIRNRELHTSMGRWHGNEDAISVNVPQIRSGHADKADYLIKMTVAHELLHAGGAQHHNKDGILNPVMSYTDFTENDRKECVRVGLCD